MTLSLYKSTINIIKRFVAYYRVSTHKQGRDGLGMDAQKEAVTRFLQGQGGELIGEFLEVESGRRKNRAELQKALQLCGKAKASLLIAKLDRLARNAAFLLNLRDSGVDFIAADMPHADKFTIGIMALLAEKERDLIADRTSAGLAAAKRKGVRLGNPNPQNAVIKAVQRNKERADEFAEQLRPIIKDIRRAGMTSLREIAFCLNTRGYKSPNGRQFRPQSIKNLLNRLNSLIWPKQSKP